MVRPRPRTAPPVAKNGLARRKDELYFESDGSIVALSLLMSQYYADAAADSPNTTAHLLWLRFVAWVRPFVAVRRETTARR